MHKLGLSVVVVAASISIACGGGGGGGGGSGGGSNSALGQLFGQWHVTSTIVDTNLGSACPALGIEDATLDFTVAGSAAGYDAYYVTSPALNTTSPSGFTSTFGSVVVPPASDFYFGGMYYCPASDASIVYSHDAGSDLAPVTDNSAFSIVVSFEAYLGNQIVSVEDDPGDFRDTIDDSATLVCSGHVRIEGMRVTSGLTADPSRTSIVVLEGWLPTEGEPSRLPCVAFVDPTTSSLRLRCDPARLPCARELPAEIQIHAALDARGTFDVVEPVPSSSWSMAARGSLRADELEVALTLRETTTSREIVSHGWLELR